MTMTPQTKDDVTTSEEEQSAPSEQFTTDPGLFAVFDGIEDLFGDVDIETNPEPSGDYPINQAFGFIANYPNTELPNDLTDLGDQALSAALLEELGLGESEALPHTNHAADAFPVGPLEGGANANPEDNLDFENALNMLLAEANNIVSDNFVFDNPDLSTPFLTTHQDQNPIINEPPNGSFVFLAAESQGENIFAGDSLNDLLEATAAAGIASAIQEQHERLYLPDDGYFRRSFLSADQAKRQREADNPLPSIEAIEPSNSKRQKTTPRLESRSRSAAKTKCSAPRNERYDSQDKGSVSEADECNPRKKLPAFHPAAILYKEPSAASKKYSRPVMSKLFTSLELQAEEFLELQSAAKSFMLDPNFPERTKSVGSRSRGESDATKQKLFVTVKSFLVDEGCGEKYFGPSVPGYERRVNKWPADQIELISRVTPLMRRMVTNERQRLYANSRRVGGQDMRERAPSASPPETTPEPTSQPSRPPSPLFCDSNTVINHGTSPDANQNRNHDGNLDSNLDQAGLSLASSVASLEEPRTPNTRIQLPITQLEMVNNNDLQYHINILRDGQRIQPKFTLTMLECPTFLHLTTHLNNLTSENGQKPTKIQILGPGCLLETKDENTWKNAIGLIKKSEWMDGEVKCLVEIEDSA